MAKPLTTALSPHNFNIDITDFLARFSAATSENGGKQSLLHTVAREGDMLSAEALLDAGSPADAVNDLGWRPLHEAAFFNRAAMIGLLLDHGAAIDSKINPLGHTPLFLAVQAGHHAAARELVRRGARTDTCDALLGQSLLHLAAARGDMILAGLLIIAGADVRHQDKKGMTARDVAAARGHGVLAKTLLKVMAHHAGSRVGWQGMTPAQDKID